MGRVLIADDSDIFIQLIADTCFAQEEVCACHDGLHTLTMLSTCRPDVLLLNLSLAYVDGLTVLRQARFLPKTVIAISYMTDPHILRTLGALGVQYVLHMPTPGSVRQALETVRENAPAVRTDLRGSVLSHLHRLGIPTELDGHLMLTVGLPLYLQDPGQTLSKELYPAIACAMDRGNSQTVERSVRQAIQAGWKRRDDRIWRQYFAPNSAGTISCPNNKKFLTALITRLQQELERA